MNEKETMKAPSFEGYQITEIIISFTQPGVSWQRVSIKLNSSKSKATMKFNGVRVNDWIIKPGKKKISKKDFDSLVKLVKQSGTSWEPAGDKQVAVKYYNAESFWKKKKTVEGVPENIDSLIEAARELYGEEIIQGPIMVGTEIN